MQTTIKLFFSCLFCLALTLLSGCGDGVPSLTAVEQAEVDKIVTEHGTAAIVCYLEKLHDESRNPDMDRVFKYLKHFVSKGADVNATNGRYGDNSLRLLMTLNIDEKDEKNQEKLGLTLRFLLDKGADVNTDLGNGMTLLHIVTRDGGVEDVRFFISRGANVNAKEGGGWTPLHYAAYGGDVAVAKFLVSKKADVNAIGRGDFSGLMFMGPIQEITPLTLAKTNGNTEMIKYLESVGAK